jgi:hypothetical protein
MKCAAGLLIVVVCSGAFASEPGQPLDCSDWVFSDPGLTCRVVIADCTEPSGSYFCSNVAGRPVVGDGSILFVRQIPAGQLGCPGNPSVFYRIEVSRLTNGIRSVVGTLSPRCGPNNTADAVQMVGPDDANAGFDITYGRLYIGLTRRCDAGLGGQCSYGTPTTLFTIEGFTTTFEILQSYTPQPSALGFRVPYMPEGMAAADHFDTYWGPLTKPLDFTQAHPLACDYPATAPHVGDYLSVSDTVPTPAPGQGVYYVTSATYQGATRYGRKTTAGHLTGRDPALLPTCQTPTQLK